MSNQEIAYEIEFEDGRTEYVRAGSIVADFPFTDNSVSVEGAIYYTDARSEWTKMHNVSAFLEPDIDTTDTNAAKIVDSIDFGAVSSVFDQETANEIERVGTNWDEADAIERKTFLVMVERLHKMSERAGDMLERWF